MEGYDIHKGLFDTNEDNVKLYNLKIKRKPTDLVCVKPVR